MTWSYPTTSRALATKDRSSEPAHYSRHRESGDVEGMTEPTPPTAPPQVSPDGQWWWNGQSWQPVQPPPQPPAPLPTPVGDTFWGGDVTRPIQVLVAVGAVIFVIWFVAGLAKAG